MCWKKTSMYALVTHLFMTLAVCNFLAILEINFPINAGKIKQRVSFPRTLGRCQTNLQLPWFIYCFNLHGIYPWKLTCSLKRCYFSRDFFFQPLSFRGHSFVFRGVYLSALVSVKQNETPGPHRTQGLGWLAAANLRVPPPMATLLQ